MHGNLNAGSRGKLDTQALLQNRQIRNGLSRAKYTSVADYRQVCLSSQKQNYDAHLERVQSGQIVSTLRVPPVDPMDLPNKQCDEAIMPGRAIGKSSRRVGTISLTADDLSIAKELMERRMQAAETVTDL